MSNNGPRYQARDFGGTVLTADKKGLFYACGVMDTTSVTQNPVALTADRKSAITVAYALNCLAMQLVKDQGNGDGC